jgi:hypothetical protein
MAFGNGFAGELIIVPGHRSLLSGLLFFRRAFRPAPSARVVGAR